MPKGIYKVPLAINESIRSYASGSIERKELKAMLKELRSVEIDIPMYIGNKEVRSENKIRLSPPHDHKHTLGHFHQIDKNILQDTFFDKNKNYKVLIALESYFISIFFSFLKTHLVNFLGIQIHIKIIEKQYI
jgi:hypothetical protein